MASSTFFVKYVPHILVESVPEVIRMYKAHRAMGYEGSVIKPEDYEYVGSRTYTWMKVKDILSEDLEVIDVYEGEGKYKGQLGGVWVNFNGVRVKVGGGWSDQDRALYYSNPERIIGQVITVLYQEVTPDGSMRSPRTTGIRFDLEE